VYVPRVSVEPWLDATHRLVHEEVVPTLKAAGFKKRGYRWTRPRPGGGQNELVLEWSRHESRDADSASFRCGGDERARRYVMSADYCLGSDAAQVSSFANSGHDAFAEAILGPLGLVARYREMLEELLSMGIGPPYSVTAPLPARDVDIDARARKVQAHHRYRWSDPEALRKTLRDDLRALLLVWDLTAYSGNDHFMRARIAAAFDERGYFRSWT
jgi:hypothetical protein